MNIDKLLHPGRQAKTVPETGVILDFIAGENNADDNGFSPETIKYQGKYHSSAEARAYNIRYRQKRIQTTRQESAILRKLLSRHSGSGAVLDLPCGGGRLSPVIGEFTRTILEMDLAPGQLLYGLNNCKTRAKQTWIRASAFDIPLQNDSVDGTVCIRLSHHLHSLKEKEKLLCELLRVSRRFVVFYFINSNAPKYKFRQWRAKMNGTSCETNSMSVRELSAMAEKSGGKVISCPASGFLQPHRYALIEKRPAA